MYIMNSTETVRLRALEPIFLSLNIDVIDDERSDVFLNVNEYAATFHTKENGFFVSVSRALSPYDRQLSLAHELGHIVLGHIINHTGIRQADFEAEAFAAFFLSLVFQPKIDKERGVIYE